MSRNVYPTENMHIPYSTMWHSHKTLPSLSTTHPQKLNKLKKKNPCRPHSVIKI